ncbi:MAG: glycoside hydrolase family 5 protein [Clostridia bacterium]|nr:glycoside hydrolase family 5 protein [Clostridia bacterium]
MGKTILGEYPMRKAFLRSAALMVVTIILVMTAAFGSVYADPEAVVDGTNPWESGGQITLTLKNCDGYNKITVVADFGGTVTDASGWGFDTYKVDGSKVTAEVTRGGQNDWAFNGSVGIQVNGSNINEIKLVSITGDSTSGTISTSTPAPTTAPTSSGDPLVTGSSENKEGKKGDDWLTTKGSKIVDQNGTEVWLTGVNWFGYNTGTNIFDGCWSCSMDGALKAIADRGFNLLRIPISAELLLNWRSGTYPNANFNQSTNSELTGMNSLEILDYALARCETYGIKVMFDIHSAETDASGHNAPLWYTGKISTEDYLTALDWLSARYKDNDTVIAYDLKNEPHGAGNEQNRAIWNDSKDPNNWPYVAALAGNTILDNNPNALIVIEGNQIFPKDIKSNNFTSMNEGDYYNAWWGGNLMGVKDYPVDLGSAERNKQIVYSPHDYGPAVYQQPWFDSGFSYQSLMDDYWYDYWFYIKDQDIAPILIGEWGGFMSGDNLTWMTYLRQLIGEYNLNYTFWCFNANSGDTGGLVKDDFTTWDEEKYSFVSEVLWKTSDGKPIGLDHEIALGANGVSLGTISGNVEPTEPTVTPEPSEETEITDETEVSADDTKVSDETTVSVSVETGVEEETTDEVSTKKADNELQLSALGNILKVVAVIAVVVVVAMIVFVVTRVIVLKRKGQSFKEILVNIFKLF